MSDEFPSFADVLLSCVPFLSISISSSGRTAIILRYKLIRRASVWADTHTYESGICR